MDSEDRKRLRDNKIFFKKFLVDIIYQENKPKMNYDAIDHEDYVDPLSTDTNSINTDTEKLSRGENYFNDSAHTKILPLNFGEAIDGDAVDPDCFYGNVDEPASEDLIRHINITGTETEIGEPVLKHPEIKNYFSESFTVRQAKVLNIILRSLELKNFKLANQLDEARKTIKDFRESEKNKTIEDRLDQAEDLVKKFIHNKLDDCWFRIRAKKRRKSHVLGYTDQVYDPLKVHWGTSPEGEKKFKDKYFKIRKQLNDYILKFNLALKSVSVHPRREKDQDRYSLDREEKVEILKKTSFKKDEKPAEN
jgi:hypothetical protein